MKQMKINKLTLSVLAIAALALPVSGNSSNNDGTAPVSGFAMSFLSGEIIPGAKITVMETGQTVETDPRGHFGPINHPIGTPITLVLEKSGYVTTQSGTFIVPKQGLIGPYDNITFQVPSTYVYYLLKKAVGAYEDPESCHLTSTIIAYHKTLDDIPQGEADATVSITPNVKETPFYFDIFKSGPLKGKTYPFPTGITKTSDDGGIAYFNLPPRDEPYTLSAQKDGVTFNSVQFICRKGAFINISPPGGPMAQKI